MKEKAENTFKAVAGMYKGGAKSDNKKYETPNTDQKKIARNNHQLENTALLMDSRKITEQLSPAKAGELLFKMTTRVGNCGEMACMALYVANTFYGVPKDQLQLQTCTCDCSALSSAHGFGHSFALLGPENGEYWVVDPWANLCCNIRDYKTKFKEKMNSWAAKGKRIGVLGRLYGTNWLMPNDSDLMTVLDSKTAKFLEYE